jgi:hypothetical protein
MQDPFDVHLIRVKTVENEISRERAIHGLGSDSQASHRGRIAAEIAVSTEI